MYHEARKGALTVINMLLFSLSHAYVFIFLP